jgi:hypothetical protein
MFSFPLTFCSTNSSLELAGSLSISLQIALSFRKGEAQRVKGLDAKGIVTTVGKWRAMMAMALAGKIL